MIFDHVPDFLQGYEVLAEETLAVVTTSIPLAAVPASSVGDLKAVVLSVNDADVNASIEGEAVADTDLFVANGSIICVTGRKEIEEIEFIRNAGTSAIVGAMYIGIPAPVTS